MINDSGLRKKSSAESMRILAKIDRLEAAIEAFRNHDLFNFRSWYELTFRQQQVRIDEATDKYQDLARLQNWTIAESRMKEISMPQAYGLVRDEEAAYARGDEKTRLAIDEARMARERFIAEEIARETNGAFDADPLDEEFGETPERTKVDDENLEYLASLSDKHLRALLSDRGSAVEVLSNVLRLASNPRELALFLKIWGSTPNKIQVLFSKQFAKLTGQSFQSVIEEIRLIIEVESSAEDDEEPEADFVNTRSTPGPKAVSTTDEIQIKTIYRKLVRFLHPDLQVPTSGKQKSWLQSVWDRTQRAYQQKQLAELNKLQVITLLRLNLLDRLTLYEIRQSATWLTEELAHLEQVTQENKRIPAWGFSRKKNTETLQKKIQRELDAELKETQERISVLLQEHSFLDFLSRAEPPTRRPRRKSKHGRKNSNRARQQRSLF